MGPVVGPDQILGPADHYGSVPLPYQVKVLPGIQDAIAGFVGTGLEKNRSGRGNMVVNGTLQGFQRMHCLLSGIGSTA